MIETWILIGFTIDGDPIMNVDPLPRCIPKGWEIVHEGDLPPFLCCIQLLFDYEFRRR